MRKHGILNDALSGALARLGHGDHVVVGDCGLPRPFGVPTFAQVIDALAAELVIETVVIARETRDGNPGVVALLTEHFGEPRWITHEELKAESAVAQLFVRTGEATPYANAILRCGVPF